MDRNELLVMGGVGVAALAAVAIAGRSKSTGAVGIGPDPNAVAAIQTGAIQQLQSYNQLATDRMKTAASTILGLAQLEEEQNVATLQDSGSTQRAQITADAAVRSASVVAQAQEVVQQYQAQSAEWVASQSADALKVVSGNTAAAQEAASNASLGSAQATANAQKTVSNNNLWSNITSTVGKLLGGIFG